MNEQTTADETPTTESILKSMLTESTGRHMLDSGGAYGRNWERNQGRDFDSEPETTIKFEYWRGPDGKPSWYLDVTHNVYHWLRERLEYAPELDAHLWAWAESEERDEPGSPYLGDPEEWLEERFPDAGGIYGDGEPVTVNTYNGEDCLPQVLQYVYFEIPDGEFEGTYVALSIHGGCDVRGGYTWVHVFEASIEDYSILDNARFSLYVDEETIPDRDAGPMLPGMEDAFEPVDPDECRWYSYDGYNVENDYRRDLCPEGTEPVFFEEDEHGVYRDEEGRDLDDVRGTGVLCIDDEGRGWCPYTGGRILAGPY